MIVKIDLWYLLFGAVIFIFLLNQFWMNQAIYFVNNNGRREDIHSSLHDSHRDISSIGSLSNKDQKEVSDPYQLDLSKQKQFENQSKSKKSSPPVLVKLSNPVVSIDDEIKSCETKAQENDNNKKSKLQEMMVDKIYDKKCNSKWNINEFVCNLSCQASEPELERTMRPMSYAKYHVRYLKKLCNKGFIPLLIWIRNGSIKFYICDNDTFHGKAHWGMISTFFSGLSCLVSLPDVIFGMDNSDYIAPMKQNTFGMSWVQPMPGTVRYSGTDVHQGILFPTPAFIENVVHPKLPGFDITDKSRRRKMPSRDDIMRWFSTFDLDSDSDGRNFKFTPWKERKPVLFWRGSTTGIPYGVDDYRFHPRTALLKNFQNIEGFDLGFTPTGITLGGTGLNEEKFRKDFRIATRASRNEHSLYRYLMHTDGNTASWGLAHKLVSGSVVIWGKSPYKFREHFYIHLNEWEHFIPSEVDWSDLLSIQAWIRSFETEEEMNKIAASNNNDDGEITPFNIQQQAKDLFRKRLRPEDCYCYVYRMIISLAKLQKNAPTEEHLRANNIDVDAFQDMSIW